MSMLEQVTTGKIKKKAIITLYGSSGVGKTTVAADFPNPVFIQTEEGSLNLNVSRFPLSKDTAHVFACVNALLNEKHQYETCVIDSADQLEAIIWKDICRENSVKEISELSFGKGYMLALKIWQDLMTKLTALREKMNVIIICHSQIKSINDPMKPSAYDRHELKLNTKAAALIKEISDAVLFATFEIHVEASSAKNGKGRAFGEGKRVLYTHGMPGHEAKNRFALPYELPLSADTLLDAIDGAHTQDPKAMLDQIETLALNIKDEPTKQKAIKAAKDAGEDIERLTKIYNKLLVMIGDSK